jgi:hypothetical protein
MNWTHSPRTLRWSLVILATLSAVCFIAAVGAEDKVPPPIDWDKAREIYRKDQSGQQLTADERAYLERAKAERARNNPNGNPGAGGNPGANPGTGAASQPAGKPSVGLKPLTEMSADDRYKEQDGGLYGKGKNEPPEGHLAAAMAAAKLIQPLDDQGKPAADGTVVLISLGMSNTTQEFSRFMQLAGQDKALSPKLKIVDGAQGGQDAAAWLIKPGGPNPGARPAGAPQQRPRPWEVLDQRLKAAGVAPAQVQAAWLKQALIQPARLGEFPAHAKTLQDDEAQIVREMKKRFPNLRIVYLSNRIYAGWAVTQLNPEPYAYENAFSVRGLIQDQIAGNKELNFDSTKGAVAAPVLLWGPYLWADGTTGRKADGLKYERVDLAGDGTHPSASGQTKVGEMLLQFFKTDPTAKGWFCTETPGR